MECDVCGAVLIDNICAECSFDNSYQYKSSRIYTLVQDYLVLYGRDEKVYEALVEITGKTLLEIMAIVYQIDRYDIEGLTLDTEGLLDDY